MADDAAAHNARNEMLGKSPQLASLGLRDSERWAGGARAELYEQLSSAAYVCMMQAGLWVRIDCREHRGNIQGLC